MPALKNNIMINLATDIICNYRETNILVIYIDYDFKDYSNTISDFIYVPIVVLNSF